MMMDSRRTGFYSVCIMYYGDKMIYAMMDFVMLVSIKMTRLVVTRKFSLFKNKRERKGKEIERGNNLQQIIIISMILLYLFNQQSFGASLYEYTTQQVQFVNNPIFYIVCIVMYNYVVLVFMRFSRCRRSTLAISSIIIHIFMIKIVSKRGIPLKSLQTTCQIIIEHLYSI